MRKRIKWISLGAVVVLLGILGFVGFKTGRLSFKAFTATQLVENPSFETASPNGTAGAKGWAIDSIFAKRELTHGTQNGNFALKVNTNGIDSPQLPSDLVAAKQVIFNVPLGWIYNASAYYKANTLQSNIDVKFKVNVIVGTDLYQTYETSLVNKKINPNTWTKINLSVKSPRLKTGYGYWYNNEVTIEILPLVTDGGTFKGSIDNVNLISTGYGS